MRSPGCKSLHLPEILISNRLLVSPQPVWLLPVNISPAFSPVIFQQGLNIKADYLSCSKNGLIPLWECLIAQCSQLRMCLICCLLPRKLLSLLAGLLLSGLTEGTYVQLATHLMTLDYVTLPVGLADKGMISSLQNL
jgi:hypothetical protein